MTSSGLSFPAATAGTNVLVDLGIVAEITGKQRNRVFSYAKLLALLQEGTVER